MASTLPPIPWDRPQTSYEWVDWYTKLRDLIDASALDHNALLNLQGGTTGEYYHLTASQHAEVIQRPLESLIVACSDETTALTTGMGKVTFRMPYAFTLTSIKASLTTAQTSGNIFTVDVKESGTSILSTKLTIDNTEKTSTTATTAAVISDTALADDSEITIDIDQIGDGTAKGLKVVFIGRRV